MQYICYVCNAGGASGTRNEGPATYHCHGCGGRSTMVPKAHLPAYKLLKKLAAEQHKTLDELLAEE